MANGARRKRDDGGNAPSARVDDIFRAPTSRDLARAANDNPFSWSRFLSRIATWAVPVLAFAVLAYAVVSAGD